MASLSHMLLCACAKRFDLSTNQGRAAYNVHLCCDGKPPSVVLAAIRD